LPRFARSGLPAFSFIIDRVHWHWRVLLVNRLRYFRWLNYPGRWSFERSILSFGVHVTHNANFSLSSWQLPSGSWLNLRLLNFIIQMWLVISVNIIFILLMRFLISSTFLSDLLLRLILMIYRVIWFSLNRWRSWLLLYSRHS